MSDEIIETPVPGPYFRFADEAAWITAAKTAGFYVTDPDTGTELLKAYTSNHAIDVIGIISEGGEWDDNDNEIEAPTVLSGWHVNYLGNLPTGWESYEVTPSTPYRVFA